MTEDFNTPLNPVQRRCAAYMTLSEVLRGDQLIQAMWMIEERDQSADRLTFLGFVGVTAEIFGIDSHEVSTLYIKLNRILDLPSHELARDPLPEMLRFRGINQTDAPKIYQNNASEPQASISNTSRSIFRDINLRKSPREEKKLSLEDAYQIGQTLACEVKKHNFETIIVARDGSKPSLDLGRSLVDGIQSMGINILDLGEAPIPLLYFVSHHFEGKTGVMITGGNHPRQHTSLKIVIAGEILEDEKIQRLKRSLVNASLPLNKVGNLEENNSFVSEYIGVIAEDIQLNKSLKIVLDSGNGIAGPLASDLMQAIGCQVVNLHPGVDQNFPYHPPDPSNPENLTDLISAVQQHHADIGFAFDNNGARLGVVDSQGKIIRADQQVMLLIKHVLAHYPTGHIIYDNQCPDHLAKLITECSGRPVSCEAEPALMRAKLKVTTAKMAGDMNGRIYLNDRWFGFDDALYAACRILEILSSDPRPSSDIFAELP